jgi:GTP pyrophosphokinase
MQGKITPLLQAAQEETPSTLAIAELEQTLFEKIKEAKIDPKAAQKALALIKQSYSGLKIKTDEALLVQAITVALTVLNYAVDKEQEIIVATLLKDAVAYTHLSLQDIEAHFGKTVAFLVGKLTPVVDKERRISLPDQERLARIADYVDARIDLIRVADRLYLMRDIQHHPYIAERIYTAQETLKEFVPLARTLKLTDIEKELEQISRKVLTNNQE